VKREREEREKGEGDQKGKRVARKGGRSHLVQYSSWPILYMNDTKKYISQISPGTSV